MKKSEKTAKGEAIEAEEDFEKNKISEDNIGFQMLKKAGYVICMHPFSIKIQ